MGEKTSVAFCLLALFVSGAMSQYYFDRSYDRHNIPRNNYQRQFIRQSDDSEEAVVQPGVVVPDSQPDSGSSSGDSGSSDNSGSGAASAADLSHIPSDDRCTESGFFKKSCTKFYRCVGWSQGGNAPFTYFNFDCAPGTAFNEKISVCDHPINVKGCENLPVPTPIPPMIGEETVSGSDTSQSGLAPAVVDSSPEVEDSSVEDGSTEDEDEEKQGVFSITCYNDNKYRQHPYYCNKYYYCVKGDSGILEVPVSTCPGNFVFNESSQMCEYRDEDFREDCRMAPPTESIDLEDEDKPDSFEENLKREISVNPMVDTMDVDGNSLFSCPEEGLYQHDEDCSKFYKCVSTLDSKLKELVFSCPEEYAYSEVNQTCQEAGTLPPCTKTSLENSTDISATPLYEHDLLWFFESNSTESDNSTII